MAAQINIMSDLATLAKLPPKVLEEISRKEALCIGSAILDAKLQQEDIAVLNIGIGTLSVELSTKQCKFIPSKELKQAIKRSLDSKVDPVELELSQDIVKKLMEICNEVL